MPLSIVLTFHSPTSPRQPLPCGTQKAGWEQKLNEGEHFHENPDVPREESLLEHCFTKNSFHIRI